MAVNFPENPNLLKPLNILEEQLWELGRIEKQQEWVDEKRAASLSTIKKILLQYMLERHQLTYDFTGKTAGAVVDIEYGFYPGGVFVYLIISDKNPDKPNKTYLRRTPDPILLSAEEIASVANETAERAISLKLGE